MPDVSWDSTNNRFVINWRFPKEVHRLTGPWFRHRFPRHISPIDAARGKLDKLAEFQAIIDTARETLADPERYAHALADKLLLQLPALKQRAIERQASLAAIKAGLNDIAPRVDAAVQRMNDEIDLRRLVARMGGAVIEPAMKLAEVIIDGEQLIQAWITERVADDDPPKPRAIQNKRSKLARLFAHKLGVKLPARTTPQQIAELLTGNTVAITEGDLKQYRQRLLAAGTAWDHLNDIKALFAVAKRSFAEITTDPAAGLLLPTKQINPRPPMSDAETAAALIASREAEPAIRWPIWLATFTTAMNSEILAAMAAEFTVDPATGRLDWDMWGRRLKCRDCRPRILPLPDDEDFLAYLATRQGKPLFDGRPASNSNRVNLWLHEHGIEKTFYSFRHRAIDKLEKHRPTLPESLVDFVCGHAGKNTRQRYYTHHELPEDYPAIIEAMRGALQDPTPKGERACPEC